MKTLFYAVMVAVMLMAVGLALAGGTMMVNTNTGAITYPTNWPTANDIARETRVVTATNDLRASLQAYVGTNVAAATNALRTNLQAQADAKFATTSLLTIVSNSIVAGSSATDVVARTWLPLLDGSQKVDRVMAGGLTTTQEVHATWLGLLDGSQAVTRAIAVAGSNLAATATGSVAVIETTKVSRVGDSMTGWLLMGTNGINVWKLGNAAGKGASGTDIIAMGSWAGDTASGNEWTAIGPYAGSAVSGDDWTAIGPYAGYTAGTAGASDHWAAFGSSAGRAASGMRWGAFGYYAGYAALSTNSYAFGSYAGRTSRGHRELFFDSYDADPNYAAGGSTNDCGYKSSAGKVYWGTGASHTEYPLAGGELRGSWYSALLAPVQSNAYDLGTQLLPYKYGYITYLVGTGFVQKVAGNGTNQVGTAAAGAMQLGVSHGRSTITATGAGSIQSGSVDAGAVATNSAAGALQLHALTAGQRAETTVDGLASLLIGAGTASNKNAVAIGDGMETHGDASLTVAGDIYHGTTNVTARLDLHQAWLGLLTPSQQVDRTIIGTVSNLVDLTTASGQVTRTMATGVISSQQVDRTWLGLLDASGVVTRTMATGLTSTQQVHATWLGLLDASQKVDRVMATGMTTTGQLAYAMASGATTTGQLAYALSFSRSWDSIGFASYAASNADTCAWGAWAGPVYVSNVWLQVDSPGAGAQTIAGRLDLVAEGTSLLAATSNLWSGLSAGTNGAAFNASTNGGIVPPGWCPIWVCTNISAIAVQQYHIRLQTWKP